MAIIELQPGSYAILDQHFGRDRAIPILTDIPAFGVFGAGSFVGAWGQRSR